MHNGAARPALALLCALLTMPGAATAVPCVDPEEAMEMMMQGAAAQQLSSSSVHLLQTRLRPIYAAPEEEEEAPEQRLARAKPIKWVHVPKCGTSFINSLIHLPGVCPTVRPDFMVDAAHCGRNTYDFEAGFDVICPDVCPGLMCLPPPPLSQALIHHQGISPKWADYEGHAAMMLRQPEQRALSAYNDPVFPYNSWPYYIYGREPKSALEFAQVLQGCATKILTRGGIDACGGPNVTWEEVAVAKTRLRQGFIFVGIVEQWELSICLLHRMYGGECKATDFSNNRPEPLPNSQDHHDTRDLYGFVDVYDGALYAEAKMIFAENAAKFDVSNSSCQPCFQQASTEMAALQARLPTTGVTAPCDW